MFKHRRKIFFVFLVSCWFSFGASLLSAAAPQAVETADIEPLKKADRILILAPHPDDETIGCAGIIQEAVKVGADIRVLYLTNGDNNEPAFIVYEKRLTFKKGEFLHMGEVRRSEAIKAMELLGVPESKLIFLGYPDFGTFTIFRKFWSPARPFKSMFTRVSAVPYKNNLSFGAPYIGSSILRDLEKVISQYQPNKIFVPHPADANVDHKALYLFLEIALADLNKRITAPKIYPYLVHWVGWPAPRHYHPQLPLSHPKEFNSSRMRWLKNDLSDAELEKKYQAILCYRSQTASSAFYLLSFARKNELFSAYPLLGLNQASLSPISYSFDKESFYINLNKGSDVNRSLSIAAYIFGYNYKVPFENMPKIRIITKYKKFKIFDGKKPLGVDGAGLDLKTDGMVLKIPLSLLGNPDFVLISAKGFGDLNNVDTAAFRKVVTCVRSQ